MKRSLNKTFSKAISFLLAFVLMVGAVPAMVFARDGGEGTAGTINYVSIGDSMTNGYGFEGYEQCNKTNSNYDFINGVGVYGEGSYALQFEQYLTEKFNCPVNHTKLAPSALLADDLLYLLGAREEEFDDGWAGYRDYDGAYSDDELKVHFQTAITEADIITMCIGNASFGAFLVQKITDTIGIMGATPDIDPNLTLENGLALLEDEEAKKIVLDIYADMKEEISAYTDVVPENIDVDAVLDVIAYTVASFLVSYEELVDTIVAMNPDVEIILIGLMNTTYGMTITGEGFEFPFGDMMDNAFEALNNYIAGVPAAKQLAGEYEEATFYYADQPAPEFIVQAFDDLAANNWENIDNGRLSGKIVRQRNIDAYNSSLRWAIGSALGFDLPAISLDDLNSGKYVIGDEPIISFPGTPYESYDSYGDYAANGAPSQEFIDKYISVAIYLAIEEAVVANVDTMDITVGGLLGIAGDIFGALGDMPDALDPSNNPGPWTIKTTLVNWFNGSENGRAMCKVYALFKVGNGMSVHPTPTGHDNIAKAVIAAYENDYTAAQKTLDTAIYLITTYYDDAYAFGYQYADENGYVDAAIAALDEAIAAVESAKAAVSEYPNVLAELEATKATLEEIKAVLENGSASDVAGLVDAVLALEDDLYTHLANLEALAVSVGGYVAEEIGKFVDFVEEKWNNEWKPALIETGKQIAKCAHDYLMEKLAEAGDALSKAYDKLVNYIIESAKEYAPQLVEALYNYLLNNPEEVIAFFSTYGPYMVDLIDEYGDEALMVVGYVLQTYGGDILAYVCENYEQILDTMCYLLKEYGDEAWALIEVYAEALGLCDAVRDQIAELEACLDELYAQLENASAEVKAVLEAKIEEVKAAIEELKAELKALEEAITAMMGDVKANIEEALAELKAAVADLKKEICDMIAEIQAEIKDYVDEAIDAAIEAVVEKLQSILDEKIETLEDLMAALEEAALDAVEEMATIVEGLVKDATHADYEVNKDSYYVAIGDDTAVSEGYVDLLAQALGIAYNNLAEAGMTVEDVAALLNKNVTEIKKADLITVGFGNTSFITNTVNQVLSGNAAPAYDWEALVGAEAAEYVEQALAELKASFENAGMDGTEMGIEDLPATMTAAVEAYVYSCVVYAVGMPEIVTAIHAINPEALVIIIGMYNPMAEVVIDLGTTTVEIGEYVNYLVGAARLESLLYAMITGNAIYVDAPAVDTNLTDTELNVLDLMREFVQQMGANLDPSEEGHAYICEQIMNALNVTKAGLLGDANGDGEVNSIDALYVKKYDAEMMDETGLDLSVSDVNGDGAVNSVDALLIQRFDAELIDAFPVEMK